MSYSVLAKHAPHAAVVAAVAAFLVLPGAAIDGVGALAQNFLTHFDWLVLWISTGCVVACAAAMAGPWARLRIGGPEARPEFPTLSWLAMLFAAGMGAGLLFWGAAEPLLLAHDPIDAGLQPDSVAAMQSARARVMFHWAIHPWAIYGISALAVAFAAHRTRHTLSPSAPFSNLNASVRHAIDWIALLCVMFGVVASLSQGVVQMSAGVQSLWPNFPLHDEALKIALLVALMGAYTLSAMGGLRRGIEPLSDLNGVLAIALLVFVCVQLGAGALLDSTLDFVRDYAQRFGHYSFALSPMPDARQAERDWSMTYFLWWVAWTPFVSAFIGRISYGRTIREFVFWVVLAPSALTLIWFAALGGAAFNAHQLFAALDFAEAPFASFTLLQSMPAPAITIAAAIFSVFIFLVTSADSACFVFAGFSTRNSQSPPVGERVFWAFALGGLTAAVVDSDQAMRSARAVAVVGSIPLLLLLAAQVAALAGHIGRQLRAKSSETIRQ